MKGSGHENAPRTADDFERLATAFRPSWELDEAPVPGAGAMSTADIRELQGVSPELRAARGQPLNGSHVAPAQKPEALPSVVVDSALAGQAPQAVPPPPPAPVSERPRSRPPAPAWPSSANYEPSPGFLSRPPSSNRTPTVPPRRAREAEVAPSGSFAQPSKKWLWTGLSAAAVILVGVGVLALSGSSQKAAPALVTTAKPADDTKIASIPPPPPETATARPAPAPPPPPAVAVPPVVTTSVLALPAAPVNAAPAAPTPVARGVAAAAPPPAPRPAYTAPPSHPAAARKGPSIVRDVPF